MLSGKTITKNLILLEERVLLLMAFLITSVIIFVTVAGLVKKNLPKDELYATFLFSIVLGYSIDIIFDLKYNIYGYFEVGVQFAGFLPILFLFPTAGILFMNFFPFKKNIITKTFYIICWSIFCLLFEFFSLKSGYFYHNEWNFWYSALVYPLLLVFHILHLTFFRKYKKKDIKN